MAEKYGRKVKEIMAKDMGKIFSGKQGFILSNISNIKASEIDTLRKNMRRAGSKYMVLKNRLAQRALKDAGIEGLDDVFLEKKVTGLGVVEDDPVQVTKIMVDFAKKNKGFELTKGYYEGQVLTGERIKELSELPGKEQLIAMVVGMLNGPITNFVGLLSSLLKSLMHAINAIKEKKEKSE
jgi:large subunit ribosomal protein L10